MDTSIIVVDNFLENPDIVRNCALSLEYPKSGSFPGSRSLKADSDYAGMIKNKLQTILGKEIFFPYSQDSFCFQICMDDAKSWVHTDETEWSAVLYLTPNAPIGSGTALYDDIRDNSDKEFTDSDFSVNTLVGNVYNRIILFKGNKNFHRSFIPGFGNSVDTARLTQVFFFNTYDNGQKQIII
jgi:hypothetical protein